MRGTTEQGGTPADVGRRRFVGAAAAGGAAAWATPAILGVASASAAGTPAPGTLRVVLTWNEVESDLDLHMSGPDGDGGDGRFHAYFLDPAPVGHVSLEDDDTTFGGPETMTITVGTTDDYVPGEYRVWVHDFPGGIDDDPNFLEAQAVITFFDLTGQVAQYRPTDPGHTGDPNEEIWRVFDFTIDVDGNVTDVTTRFLFADGSSGTVY